ncbi:TetR family transcriptional regulator [Microbacterium sp. NPDC089189]|uniref:TetR family transcriptional regulator n=1 Tax=Microbacterium sp. NPDC089189 TaxID=3154972 RepID=UPI00342B7404
MPDLPPRQAPTLRQMTRDAVRARIADAAIDLFAEHGFDQVTVEQIATSVGISTRSFNRYFPAKEDVVMGGDGVAWGELVSDAFVARPAEEPVWSSLHAAYASMLATSTGPQDRQKLAMRVLISAPTLRARNLEKHLAWAQLLTPLVAARLTGADAEVRAEAIVQASLACLDVALLAWAREDEHRSPSAILQTTFDALSATV